MMVIKQLFYKLQFIFLILIFLLLIFFFKKELIILSVFADYTCTVNNIAIQCPYPDDCTSRKFCDLNLDCVVGPACKSSGVSDSCTTGAVGECYEIKGYCTNSGFCETYRVPKGQGGGCQQASDCKPYKQCYQYSCQTFYSHLNKSDTCNTFSDCGCYEDVCDTCDVSRGYTGGKCLRNVLKSPPCQDECKSDKDCPRYPHWTCACGDERCTSYNSCGLDDCKSGDYCSSCGTVAHKECSNDYKCILVDGPGINQCNTDEACKPKHRVCDENVCRWVEGEGVNECEDSSDCTSSPPTPTTTPPSPPPPTTTTTYPPPTPPPPPKCFIFFFKINEKDNSDRDPLIFWVNQTLKGVFSVNDICKKCVVESNDTWGNPPKFYPISSPSNLGGEETFSISTAGDYSFTLKCTSNSSKNPLNCTQDDEDCAINNLSLKNIKVYNLPFWHEIIPVLPGFLRGLFRR